MARFNAAVMDGALDKKFQNRYNYLLDLLDTAYTVEKRVNSELRKVTINPEDLISITVGDNEVFGIDEAGRVFASSLTNNSDSDCYLAVGSVGTKIGMLLYRKSISESIPIMRFVVGSGSAPDPGFHWEYYDSEMMFYSDGAGWIRKVDGVIREMIGADGEYFYKDHNGVTRFHLFPDGGIELVDTSGQQVFTAQGGASEDVFLTCKNDNTKNIGVNSTGAYYTDGSGTKVYLNSFVKKSEVLYSVLSKSSDQTFGTSTSSSVVKFDTETGDCSLDSYGCKVPTGNFIAIVTAWIWWDANSTGLRFVKIRKNSTDISMQNMNATSSGIALIQASASFAVTTGDIIYAYVYQNSGGDLNMDLASRLFVTLIPTD